MKKFDTLTVIMGVLLITAALYLSFAMVEAEWNPFKWNFVIRLLFVAIELVLLRASVSVASEE